MDGRNFSMSNHDEDEGADYGVLEPLNNRPARRARRSQGRPTVSSLVVRPAGQDAYALRSAAQPA